MTFGRADAEFTDFGAEVRVRVGGLACVKPDHRTFGDWYTSLQEMCSKSSTLCGGEEYLAMS